MCMQMAKVTQRSVMLLLGSAVCVFLSCVVRLADGEDIFFHRDHHDQGIYRNENKFEGVTNYEQLVVGNILCNYVLQPSASHRQTR